MRKNVLRLVGIMAAGAALLGASSASATVTCDRVVSPSGSDSAAGSVAAPFKTAQKLVNSLSPGQTGCFRAGTTTGSVSIATQGVTLTSYPGERATVQGRIWVTDQGAGTTVADLNLDGRPGVTSPTISADNVTFSGNDVTNYNTAICFSIGSATYRVHNTVIVNNNIHNCGVLPSGNQDHGIYIVSADSTLIRGNWIHDNADRGVQLYPDADHTEITGNVIDSNGEGIIFGGNGSVSDNNTVEHNVITNSQIRQNVESYYGTGGAPGVGNVVTNNCIKGAPGSYAGQDGAGIMSPQAGFSASSNLVADPQYVNQAAGNYNLQSSSPCASILAGANVDPGTTTSTPPPTSTAPPTTGPAPSPTPSTHKKKARSLRAKAKARATKALKRRS